MDAITAEVLDRTEVSTDMKRVLFGTSNSHLWARGETKFQEEFVAITEDGAEWLVERGVKLVGVDYLSVAPFNDLEPTHKSSSPGRCGDRRGFEPEQRYARFL